MKYSVAFDLDGTLVDLPVDIEKARSDIAALFASYGYHEPMRPILDAINRAAATVAKSDGDIFPLILQARKILDDAEVVAAKQATPRPGAIDAIAKLRKKGIALGIVTNNSRACVPAALAAMGLLRKDFVVVTRDDVRRPKPAPDGLIQMAGKIGAPGENMWFIGDSPVDVSAAVAANYQVKPTLVAVAVPGPRSSLIQLKAAGPAVVCASLKEAIHRIVKGKI